jgi:hypothetical protein
VGRGVLEQRPYRRRSASAPFAQSRSGEISHHGAAGRAPTLRLSVDLGEEIIWKRDPDLCHESSMPWDTRRKS